MGTQERSWPLGNAAVAAALREPQGSTTPLGPVLDWPGSLKVAAQLVLDSPFPSLLLWGPDLLAVPNDAALDYLNATPGELIGRPARELLDGDWPATAQDLARVLQGQSLFFPRANLRLASESGPLSLPHSLACSPVRDETGAASGVLVVASPLGAGEPPPGPHEPGILDLVLDLLWRAGPDGGAVWCNRRWFDYTGQTLDQARGTGWLDAVHPDDRERFVTAMLEPAAPGRRHSNRYRLRSAAGEHRWFLVQAEAARDDEGQVLAWYGSATDISGLLAAEGALDESETKYRTLFSAMNEGLALVRAIRDPNGRVVDYHFTEANAAFERLTGLSDPVGRTALELTGTVEPAWLEQIERALETGEPIVLDAWNEAT
ncbi:MAG TPA: PAS domain-containing protein, partial [Deinococcales bacterium]|nr:PAS domain-containing protein [Deinococcales bacterium]